MTKRVINQKIIFVVFTLLFLLVGSACTTVPEKRLSTLQPTLPSEKLQLVAANYVQPVIGKDIMLILPTGGFTYIHGDETTATAIFRDYCQRALQLVFEKVVSVKGVVMGGNVDVKVASQARYRMGTGVPGQNWKSDIDLVVFIKDMNGNVLFYEKVSGYAEGDVIAGKNVVDNVYYDAFSKILPRIANSEKLRRLAESHK